MITTREFLITESDDYDAQTDKLKNSIWISPGWCWHKREGSKSCLSIFRSLRTPARGGDRRLCNEKGNRYKDNDIGKLQYHLHHESKFIVTRKLFVMNHKSFTSSCLVVPGGDISWNELMVMVMVTQRSFSDAVSSKQAGPTMIMKSLW